MNSFYERFVLIKQVFVRTLMTYGFRCRIVNCKLVVFGVKMYLDETCYTNNNDAQFITTNHKWQRIRFKHFLWFICNGKKVVIRHLYFGYIGLRDMPTCNYGRLNSHLQLHCQDIYASYSELDSVNVWYQYQSHL